MEVKISNLELRFIRYSDFICMTYGVLFAFHYVMVKLIPIVYLLGMLSVVSCSKAGPDIFKKNSLHEQYTKMIKDAGLDKTTMGIQWLSEAEKAFRSPQSISLPYKEMGYFSSDQPRAVGLRFKAKRGEKLSFDIEKNPKRDFVLFAELWQIDEDGKRSMLLFLH